jgi:hypothetical protein
MSSIGPDGEELEDGFRPRRKRPKGWLEKAIKSGEVRDPNAPDPDEGADYGAAEVVNPPVATVDTGGEGQGG